MSDRLQQRTRYFNCIVFCAEKEGRKATNFLKYHGIKNTDRHKGKFLSFVKKKFPSAQHVNFYDKETKSFIEKIYLE